MNTLEVYYVTTRMHVSGKRQPAGEPAGQERDLSPTLQRERRGGPLLPGKPGTHAGLLSCSSSRNTGNVYSQRVCEREKERVRGEKIERENKKNNYTV